MRKQDYLVNLIHHLTPAEKKFFKEYTGRNQGSQSFMKLYEELQKADSYDAGILCEKLKKTKANLAHEKEYLQEVLFRAMREHHKDEADIARANSFSDILILFQKGCYEMAADMTEKAIKEAQKSADTHLLNKFYAMQRNINGYMRQNGDEKYKLWDENIAATDLAMSTHYIFWQLQKIAFHLTRMAGRSTQTASVQDVAELEGILQSKWVAAELSHPLHRVMQASIRSKIYTRLGDRELALRYMVEDMEIHEQHFVDTGVDEKLYFVAVQNVINMMIYCRKIKEAEDLLIKIQSRHYHSLPLNKAFLDKTFDAHHVESMLKIYSLGYRDGIYTKAQVEERLRLFEKDIAKVEPDIMPQHRMMPYYIAAKIAFLIEDYDTSLKWFDKVLSFSEKEGSGDPMTSSRMAVAVIYYQLGSYTLCKSLAASTSIFIKKYRAVSASEKAVLKFLSNSWRLTDKNQRLKAMSVLKGELDKLKKDPMEKRIQAIFHYDTWISKNLENTGKPKRAD